MITEIKYKDKVALQNDTTIADENKVTAEDMNEIKNAINENAKELEKTQDDNTINKQDIANIKTKNTEQDTKIQTNETEIASIKTEQNTQNTNIKALQDDNEVNKTDIANIKVKNEEQDTYIEELEAETERLRKDLDALPSVKASGEYIHVEDSAESRFKSFKVCGNSKQETREGYNLLDMRNAVSYPDSGITCTVKEDGSYSYVGTATNDAINVWFRGGYYSEITEENTLFVLEAGTYYIKDVVLFSGTSKIDTINQIATLTKDMSITGIRAPSAKIGTTYNEIKYPIVAKSDVAVEWEQYGATPSLEFPSEVQAVGDNKNLLKNTAITKTVNGITFTVNEDGTVTANGTATSTSYIAINTFSYIANQDYILSGCPTGGSDDTYKMYSINVSTGGGHTNDYGKGGAIKVSTDQVGEIRIRIASGYTANNLVFKPKLEKGTISTPYSHYGQGSANVTICNKNFYDKNNAHYLDGYGLNATGFFAREDQRTYIIPIQQDEKNITVSYTKILTGSRYYAFADEIPTGINSSHYERIMFADSSDTGKITFTAKNNNYKYLLIGSTTLEVFTDLQVEQSEVSTEYVEHKEQTFTVPVQQEFMKINDINDTFVKVDGNWYEKHFIAKKIFDGTESWTVHPRHTNDNFLVAYIYMKAMKSAPKTDLLSNYFNAEDAIGSKNCIYASYKEEFDISISKTIASTIDELKSKLSEYNANGKAVEIYYPLENPLLIKCTSEQKAVLDEIEKTAQSYKNETNIYSTDELSPVFEVEYRKKIESLTGTADSVDWSNVQNKPDLVAITDEEIDNIINY